MHKVNPHWMKYSNYSNQLSGALRRLSPAWIYVSQLSKQACSWENREPRKQTGESWNWTPTTSNGESQTAIMHELRSKEFLLFRGIPMNEKSETSETSENIIRTFISEKLHFSAWNLGRIIFSNVHRLPRKTTSAITSSSSATAPPIVVKFVTMKDRNSIFNLASHVRQFECSITKYLPLAMQIQRRTLLKIANKLYKQGTRIQWKIINADYRLFIDGELVHSNV